MSRSKTGQELSDFSFFLFVGMQTGPSHSWAMDVTELPFSPSFYQPE
jgi:hypothetical protein